MKTALRNIWWAVSRNDSLAVIITPWYSVLLCSNHQKPFPRNHPTFLEICIIIHYLSRQRSIFFFRLFIFWQFFAFYWAETVKVDRKQGRESNNKGRRPDSNPPQLCPHGHVACPCNHSATKTLVDSLLRDSSERTVNGRVGFMFFQLL